MGVLTRYLPGAVPLLGPPGYGRLPRQPPLFFPLFDSTRLLKTYISPDRSFCLFSPDHIVYESSQTMTDIPYGDCFTVDQRWDVKTDQYADPDRPQVG